METTLQAILENAESLWADKPFVYTRNAQSFSPKTFGNFGSDVRDLAAALMRKGFSKKHILIYGENSYEWMVADYAVCGYVGVSAVLNKDMKKKEILSAIKKTDIAAVFYSPHLSNEIDGLSEMFGIPFFSLQKDLYQLIDSEGSRKNSEFPKPDINALCKIFFTSGTTGAPKAAMLSQKNIFSGVNSLFARVPMNDSDSGYLFLPLSHTYGGIYNFIYCLIYGAELYLCSDTNHMAEELRMVRPTIFCAVPRILERFLAAAKASDNSAETLKQMLGGNIRYLFCSGGSWRPEDRAFYKAAGLNLLEAYALTETASSLSVAYSGDSETESVGVAFEEIEVKIADPDENGYGEIWVRGDNVFLGYYKDEEATKAAIDKDGFLHTGDIGKADDTRHLYITGRKNRQFKTSAGEFVSPETIELILTSKPEVKSASVINLDGRVAAVLELSDPLQDITKIIEDTNQDLPSYMRIQEYSVAGQTTDTTSSSWKTAL